MIIVYDDKKSHSRYFTQNFQIDGLTNLWIENPTLNQ